MNPSSSNRGSVASFSVRAFSLLACSPLCLAQGDIRWERHTGRARDGSALPGMLGRLEVPENRSDPDGQMIELAFVRYESTNPDPGPPIFYLAGGPGGPGIGTCEYYATAPELALLELGDVIGLDQRGTGLSVPNLAEAPDFSYELPLDRVITKADVVAADREAIEKARAYWGEQGVDLSAYNTIESADDIDALREALGLEQIVLVGDSYGTHLGLAYLRRHAEHVERAVLRKVEGPDQTWKLPSQIQHQVDLLHAAVAADERAAQRVPDFKGALKTLLEQLAREPVEVTLEAGRDKQLVITCGPYELQRGIGMLLASREGLSQAVLAVEPLLAGDFSSLGRIALRVRRGGDASMMTLMMDCSSGATAARRERIQREAADPSNLLSDTFDGYFPEICSACGDPDLGDAFRGPLDCDVPVLFVSGSLDARTPPSNVEEIRAGFSRSAHVVVDNVGHGPDELRLPEFCDLLGAFLCGEDVEDATLALPPVELIVR